MKRNGKNFWVLFWFILVTAASWGLYIALPYAPLLIENCVLTAALIVLFIAENKTR